MTQIFLKRTTLVVFAALSLVLVPAALILAPGSLRAQTLTSGDIAGTVMDSSGAVVPNAKVKATNTGTGATKEVVSDAAGNYRISLLQPGSYTVTATSPGFQSQQFDLVMRRPDCQPEFQAGDGSRVRQTVEVMGAEIPLLQTR